MSLDLQIDTSVCRHMDDISARHVMLWGDVPLLVHPLRELDDATLRSAHVELPAGWRGNIAAEGAGLVQIFVRSGLLDVGEGKHLATNGFAVVSAVATLAVTAIETSTLIVIFDPSGSAANLADGPRVIEDAFTLDAITPVIEGKRLEGFEGRRLWRDPETGASTAFLLVPAGFRGGGPNWHPVHEEIFCLGGDIQPDETRQMRNGSFLWNPARAVHGFDEVSTGGSLLLEWHDGASALNYARDVPLPERYRSR